MALNFVILFLQPGAKSGLASFLPEPKGSKVKSIALVPSNVQSRIQAARSATKHKKLNLTGTAKPIPNEKEDPDDSFGTSFFSHLESKPVEAPSAKVGPRMPHKPQVDPFSLYDYEGDGTALVDDPQLNEGTQSEQQQQQQQLHSLAGVQGRLLGKPDGNDSANLDPEAVSMRACMRACVCACVHVCVWTGNLVLTRAPNCNTDGYLVISGEANVQLLFMSC